ncbi:hypothetical protein KDC96_03155 [Erythrobacter sp. JK5]|nr:hypothetical protein KDC96_03155 [Erythrobacter sp. JK5]
MAAAMLSLATVGASPAVADDPKDPAMQSKEARERDAAEIRRLNREQLRYVQRRDAEYARGWQATRDHKAAMAEYERRMAAWREAVRRCKAGDYRYCER